MKKIKVLYVHTLPVISGSSAIVLLTMRGLPKAEYEPHLATASDGPFTEQARGFGFMVHQIPHMQNPINPWKDLLAVIELVHLMKRERVDIVHSCNSRAGILARVSAKIAGVRGVVHSVMGYAFLYEVPPITKWFYIVIERIAAHLCHKLIFISLPMMKWGKRYNMATQKKAVLIYSGIDEKGFDIKIDICKKKKEFGIKPDELVVGLVSKLWEGKGHIDFLNAAKVVLDSGIKAKFMLIGEGYLRERLEKYAKKIGIDEECIFTGFRKDIPDITSILDISVLPSHWEGMGRVLLEAIYLGKPIVATRVGGIPDIVKENKNGFLVRVGDVRGLAERILQLLKDGDLRERMGSWGRSHFREEWTSRWMCQQIESVYREVVYGTITEKT